MGRRGPSPDHAKREAFAKLIAEGVPSARACRMVGINPRTGKRWRNGRQIPSENTNGLLRAYFPKSTDLSVHTADDIALVQLELNHRPRKGPRLGQPCRPAG